MAKRLHPEIRAALGAERSMSDQEVLREARWRTRMFCKPCWELKYCPYGPLVELMPLRPMSRADAQPTIERERTLLAAGMGSNGRPLSKSRQKELRQSIAFWESQDLPEWIPDVVNEMACTMFGHLCPVFFRAEYFTETTEQRRVGRYIPFRMKIRVARRDNYTCQHCGKHLKDEDIEFDHVIPLSKGGSSEEHNIRLTCFDCNRDKSNRVDL